MSPSRYAPGADARSGGPCASRWRASPRAAWEAAPARPWRVRRHLPCLLSRLAKLSRDGKTRREVCPLSRGVMLPAGRNPYPRRLPAGVRFLPPPLPAAPSAPPRGSLSLDGRTYGLTVFRADRPDGVGPLFPPAALGAHDRGDVSPCTRHVPFGSSLSAPLACSAVTTVDREFTCADRTVRPWPRPP